MISLRAVESADSDALHAIFTEPGVRQFLFDDALLTRAETQQHVEAAREHGGWAVCVDGRVVGLVSLRPTGADRELMIALSERCWGRSLAFQAAQSALRHGFGVLKLPRILAAVDLPNARSHRLMARLGFAPVGEVDGPKYRALAYVAFSAAASSTSSTQS
jgi:ribosomal-protein-alanine N-acetyltransferase